MEPISPEKYLENIISPLVEFPGDISISKSTDEMGVLLSLRVRNTDMGKIIGRSGDTAKAIRRVVATFGMLNRQKVSLKIFEPVQ